MEEKRTTKTDSEKTSALAKELGGLGWDLVFLGKGDGSAYLTSAPLGSPLLSLGLLRCAEEIVLKNAPIEDRGDDKKGNVH